MQVPTTRQSANLYSLRIKAESYICRSLPAYLPNRMTSVASTGLLALSKAQTYQSFYRSDTNPSYS